MNVGLMKFLHSLKQFLYRRKYVAMFHTGRCGSTVLGNMLDAHTKISWGGEIFEKYMHLEEDDRTTGFMSKTIVSCCNKSKCSIYGFETKYLPQLHLSDKCLNMSLEDYITSLHSLGFSYFIALHRKNYLRRAISAQVGKERGEWHSKEKVHSPTKVHIDIKSFPTGSRRGPLLELFKHMDESYDRLRHSLPSNSLFLTYEDDIQDDPLIAYKKVCKFLDVTPETPKIRFSRTNPFSYEQMVTNIDEVKAVLENTKYSWMLEN